MRAVVHTVSITMMHTNIMIRIVFIISIGFTIADSIGSETSKIADERANKKCEN